MESFLLVRLAVRKIKGFDFKESRKLLLFGRFKSIKVKLESSLQVNVR
jgi:hypothetical protein